MASILRAQSQRLLGLLSAEQRATLDQRYPDPAGSGHTGSFSPEDTWLTEEQVDRRNMETFEVQRAEAIRQLEAARFVAEGIQRRH